MISLRLDLIGSMRGTCAWCSKKHRHRQAVTVKQSDSMFVNIYFCTNRCRKHWWLNAFGKNVERTAT